MVYFIHVTVFIFYIETMKRILVKVDDKRPLQYSVHFLQKTMKRGSPVGPDEIAQLQAENIPGFVFDAVNALLARP